MQAKQLDNKSNRQSLYRVILKVLVVLVLYSCTDESQLSNEVLVDLLR